MAEDHDKGRTPDTNEATGASEGDVYRALRKVVPLATLVPEKQVTALG